MQGFIIGLLLIVVVLMGYALATPFLSLVHMFGFEQAILIIFLSGGRW